MDEEKVRDETIKHIADVGRRLCQIKAILNIRMQNHDKSKLEEPEFPVFVECTPKLAGMTYGSDEYNQCLSEMKPALDHHYSHNRHHPEFHKNGIDDMDLIDIIEMICDWMAAVERHDDGDIMRSLKINKDRFGISDQLYRIMVNTVNNICNFDKMSSDDAADVGYVL